MIFEHDSLFLKRLFETLDKFEFVTFHGYPDRLEILANDGLIYSAVEIHPADFNLYNCPSIRSLDINIESINRKLKAVDPYTICRFDFTHPEDQVSIMFYSHGFRLESRMPFTPTGYPEPLRDYDPAAPRIELPAHKFKWLIETLSLIGKSVTIVLHHLTATFTTTFMTVNGLEATTLTLTTDPAQKIEVVAAAHALGFFNLEVLKRMVNGAGIFDRVVVSLIENSGLVVHFLTEHSSIRNFTRGSRMQI